MDKIPMTIPEKFGIIVGITITILPILMYVPPCIIFMKCHVSSVISCYICTSEKAILFPMNVYKQLCHSKGNIQLSICDFSTVLEAA